MELGEFLLENGHSTLHLGDLGLQTEVLLEVFRWDQVQTLAVDQEGTVQDAHLIIRLYQGPCRWTPTA